MATRSFLCQLNGGCMGCCGRQMGSPEQIQQAIQQNTQELQELHPQARGEFVSFRERYPVDNLHYGVCRNLVAEKGCLICPLHPARHKEDLRLGHCDVDYLCPTAREANTWHKKRQEKFIQFITAKGLNNIDYSLTMQKGELLKEFLS